MSLRWRHPSGEIYCAAKSEPRENDTYIDDTLHYELSVIQKVLVPDKDEDANGRWYWLHGWCTTSDHPEDVPEGTFIRAEMPPRKLTVDRRD